MLRRIASGLVFGAILGASAGAQAFGGWMAAAPGFVPLEQRVAVAVTPQRTTLWTSLRFVSQGGAVGVVIPVAPGASVDIASDAWFEALEVATAPRVFPYPQASPYCPGVVPGPSAPYDTAGHVDHTVGAALLDSALLDDTSGLQSWAQERGLTMSAALQAGLGNFAGASFLAIRFQAPAGHSLLPTLRVAIPAAVPTLPLSLTEAGSQDLLVTTWLLGTGVGQLDGSAPLQIEPSSLVWDAEAQTSNYAEVRLLTFTSGADFILEAAGHDGIAADTPILGGASIDGLVRTYFDRATAYDGEPVDPSVCLPLAAADFSSTEVVAPSCPSGWLVAPPAPCVEAPPPGTLDPATLRCGSGADDLAVALSGGSPGATWLTRQSLVIQSGDHGFDWHTVFAGLTPLIPVVTTASVDTSSCPSSTGAGGGTSAGWGEGGGGPQGGYGPQQGSVNGLSGGDDVDLSGVADSLSSDSGSGCDGTSVDSGSCGGDSGGDCGGDSGGDCSGGDVGDIGAIDCSMHPRRAPRLSPALLLALAILAPLRRRGTAARREVRR